jgi:crotonobetaine/carnitine-CoA ligase
MSQPAWPANMPGPFELVPREPLLRILSTRLERAADRPLVLFDDGAVLSCSSFKSETERFASGLQPILRPGDCVVLAVGNRAEFLIAYFAILATRATAVTLSPDVGLSEAGFVLEDLDIRLVIAEEPAAKVFEQASAGTVPIMKVGPLATEPNGLRQFSGQDKTDLADVDADLLDVTAISYSSGTTGLPKAMAFNHEEVLRYADIMLRTFPFGPGDRVLCPVKFHYGDPLWLLLASFLYGNPLIMMRKFSVSRLWAVAREFEATRLMSIGAIPSLLLSAEPTPDERNHSVSWVLAVAVPKSEHAELVSRFGCQWLEYYGSSEGGAAIGMPAAHAEDFLGTGALGIPFPEVDTRLVDPHGQELHGATSGELEVKSPYLPFSGYLGNPQATAEVMRGDWLRTGDLMRRDALGVYYFEGRRKELIRRGGENIAPAEIESTLRLHPAVVDAAVVPVPDRLRDEEVKAYVHVQGDVTPAELAEHCARLLAPFKVPRYIEVRTEDFPRTPSQRIPKNELKVDGVHRIEGVWDREGGAQS